MVRTGRQGAAKTTDSSERRLCRRRVRSESCSKNIQREEKEKKEKKKGEKIFLPSFLVFFVLFNFLFTNPIFFFNSFFAFRRFCSSFFFAFVLRFFRFKLVFFRFPLSRIRKEGRRNEEIFLSLSFVRFLLAFDQVVSS